MSEESFFAFNDNKPAEIGESLVEHLFTALNDPEPEVRTQALRLMVRLPLTRPSWFRLADIVGNELSLYLVPEGTLVTENTPPPDGTAQARFPFAELLEAALLIPMSSLRHILRHSLQEDIPWALREQVVWGLAKARDYATIDLLLPSLESSGGYNPELAAYWLAHNDFLYILDEVRRLAVNYPDPMVRFWLFVGLLRYGEPNYLIDLLQQYADDQIDLPVLWGNPLQLAQDIVDCGPFPDSLLDTLQNLPNKENLPLIDELIDALAAQSAEVDTTDYPLPSTPWAGNLELLVESFVTDTLQPDGEDGIKILQQLTPPQKTTLISAWFIAIAKRLALAQPGGAIHSYTGVGNPIIQLPGWFWQGFDPDIAQLYEVYLLLPPELGELAEQLAWVISRAGLMRLAEEYLPLVPLVEGEEKIKLLHLLERAIIQSRKNFGPIFGAGAGASEEFSANREYNAFIDMEMGAGEETPLTLTDEEQPPRYLQGEVYDNSDKEHPQQLELAFLAGKEHLLKVWIGELQAGTIAAPVAIDLGELPDLPSWDLQVYFWEPNHAPAAQVGKLTVYRDQLPDLPVSTCEFSFTPRSDLPNFQGRLAVVYQKNVLQMLFLEGKVVAEAASAAANDRIRFQWAEVKGLGNVDQLQEFDLVFYNEVDPIQGSGFMFFGGQAGLKQVSGLQQGIQDMIEVLKEAGAPGKPSLKARKDSLLTLAVLGSMLYTAIEEQIGSGDQALLHLRQAQRLQLVSAVRDVFPLELVYVYPPPQDGADLCPNAEQAIQMGTCLTCEGLDEAHAAKVICPLGFLGLRCTIERHAIQPLQQTDTILEGKDYQLRLGLSVGGKTIDPLKSSLGSTSGRVEAVNKKKFTTTMQTLFPDHFVFAENWAEWKNNVKDKTFLVLIPHTLKDRSIPSLEIGNTKLWQTAIKDAVGPGTKPVVLLIGCETAVPDVPYQGYAAAFAKAGAVIIVTTLSPIHESRAVPITGILVNQIRQSAQMQQTFSEALLQARRNAMAAGYAEALTLVADGDADWILVEEG